MKARVYARVSTERQETMNQLAQLRSFAATQGWNIDYEYLDYETGSKSDRVQFQQMLTDASQRKFDALLFWSLDRLSREGALETLQYLQRLTSYGVAWRSFTEPYFDSCGIFKDAIVAIIATLAKQERIRISERTRAGLARLKMHGIAAVLGPLLMAVPPRLGSKRPGDLLQQLRTAWKLRGLDVRGVGDVTRLFTMSITDLLNDWFESEQVKTLLMVNGIIGAWTGPDEPGTAYVMLHHSVGDVGDGHLGNWAFVKGGMGGVSDAIQHSAQEYGCEVRVNAPVEKILCKNGRAQGVALRGGEELRAPVIVTTIHPKITFLKLIDRSELPGDFVVDMERWKSRSGVVKINLALSELPNCGFSVSCRRSLSRQLGNSRWRRRIRNSRLPGGEANLQRSRAQKMKAFRRPLCMAAGRDHLASDEIQANAEGRNRTDDK